jgi:non-specific riboncleoside hydrolase
LRFKAIIQGDEVMTRKIIIDTDPGIDDAAALAVALNDPQLDVLMLSTVAGNVNLSYTTENAKKILDFFAKDIPIAQGNRAPLLVEYEDASEIHGETGLNGYQFPVSKRVVLSEHAVIAMKNKILQSAEKVTLVAIGPLTNLALLLNMYPEVKTKIAELIIMGGSTAGGNTNSAAEFNFKVDPHAAQIVLQSGVPLTIFGLNVTSRARLKLQDINQIKTFGRTGAMLYDLFSHYRGGDFAAGLMIHDLCTIVYLLQPELFTLQYTHVEVATTGPAAGTLIADLQNRYCKSANANLAVDIAAAEFADWVKAKFSELT